MTAITFTQAQVRRAVKAAESAGLHVTRVTVNPDGSITVDSGDKTEQSVDNTEEAAGIHGKSAHGIRKAAATRAANNGATVAMLEAIFGWEGGQMAALYTKAADRRRLAAEHMEKLSKAGTSIPAPSGKVRAVTRKDE